MQASLLGPWLWWSGLDGTWGNGTHQTHLTLKDPSARARYSLRAPEEQDLGKPPPVSLH